MVDLGGSLAVASRGLFATGVSTDLNGMSSSSRSDFRKPFSFVRFVLMLRNVVTYLNSGGKVGDTIRAEATCDKCTYMHTRLDADSLPN